MDPQAESKKRAGQLFEVEGAGAQRLKTHKKHSAGVETMRFPAHGGKHPKNDSNAQNFSLLSRLESRKKVVNC